MLAMTSPAGPMGPMGIPGIPDAAPTDRADTMAAHHPPTFTVYTPDQVRAVPFRKSMPAYDEVHEVDGIGARTLLKWTGIGIVAGLAVLTALIVVLNFGGGDHTFASVNTRSALVSNHAAEPSTPATPAKAAAAAPTPAKPAAAATPDFEIDTPAPTPPPAKKAKLAKKRKR